MNEFDESDCDNHAIDRLVDGDLDERQRRAVLLELERSPDGWRRCALAFLEAQSWRAALGDVAKPRRSPREAALAVADVAVATPPSALLVKRTEHRATARPFTALLLCLAIGFALGSRWQTHERAHSTPTVAAGGADFGADRTAPSTTAAEPSAADAATNRASHPPLPDYVRAQLERRGYRLVQKPGLLPMELGSGHTVFVPVSQTELRKDATSRIF